MLRFNMSSIWVQYGFNTILNFCGNVGGNPPFDGKDNNIMPPLW